MQANSSVSASLTIMDTDISADERGRFCLNDLHAACGGAVKHKPGQWMRHDSFRGLVAELRKGAETHLEPVETTRGRNGGTFVCRELVIAYAMWVSPAFMLQVIRAFDSTQQRAMHAAAVQHQELAQLVLTLQGGKDEASACGRYLGKWGKRRRTMLQRIERLEAQLQIAMDFEPAPARIAH